MTTADEAADGPGPLARWTPGVIDLVVVALVLPLLLRPVTLTYDFWWHLRLGRRILEEDAFPTRETFSWTCAGAPLHHSSWLMDALYALLERAGGVGLVEVSGALLIALTLRLTYALVRALGGAPLPAVLAVLALATSSLPFLILRPHLVTLAAFAWWLLEYVRVRQGAPLGPRIAGALAGIVLWSNLHGGFLLGVALLAGVGALDLLEGRLRGDAAAARRGRVALALAAGAALAACAHPQGLAQLTWSAGAVTDPSTRHIDEWLPTPLLRTPLLEPLVLLAVVLALVVPRWPPAFEVCALLGSAHLALTAWRHLPLFGIAGHAVLAAWATRALASHGEALGRVVPAVARGAAARLDRLCGAGERGPGGWLLLLALALALGAARAARPSDPFAHPYLRETYPVEAAAWVRRAGLKGEMFNFYGWGGYLGHALEPEHRVYIDSRLSPFGWELLEEYFLIHGAHPGWEAALDRRGVDWVFVQARAPLVAVLEVHPGWRRAYADDVAAVFVRR